MTRAVLLVLALVGPGALLSAFATEWRAPLPWLGGVLLGFSTMVAVLNFYLSALRQPLLRARGVPPQRIRHVSGAPMVGMLIVPAVYLLPPSPWLALWATAAHAIDTGNPTWLAYAVWADDSFFSG